MKRIILIFIVVISSEVFGQQKSLYLSVIQLSHTSQYQEVIKLKDQIYQLSDSEKKNDLLIALSYAYLNHFNYSKIKETLSQIKNPNHLHIGALHQIQGLYFTVIQRYNNASEEFKMAMDEFSLVDKKMFYYEACNNLAHVETLLGSDNPTTNLLLDQVIEYCETSKDSVLLAKALLNRSISYPFNSASLQERAYLIGSQGTKSTAAFIRGQQSKNIRLLEHALELNPIIDNSFPAPLKVNEKAEIIMAMSKMKLRTNPRQSLIFLKLLRYDTSYLPLNLKNQVNKIASSAYQNMGGNFIDSSNYFLKKIHRVHNTESDSITIKIANSEWPEAESPYKNKPILYLILAFSALGLTIYFFILFIRSFRVTTSSNQME